ncbi:MAG: beta-glucosidase [Clostridiales bacterium]|nr:beta-glucosidase [Clostridiales bacterium]
MTQIVGQIYEEGAVVTGPVSQMGITEANIQMAGTILSSIGAKKLKQIQTDYMEKHPHGIPMLFMADIINGYQTIFPIPLAQGCTFEPELLKEGASIAAKESAAAGLHVTFSPMVDLVRDARWGRVMESTGEDTYLNACYAKAMIEGYQGKDVSEKGKLAACVKHFAGYGAPVGGRDYNEVELSERTLREAYLPAYKAAIDAGSELVMTSFNTLDRIPSTGNKWLMQDVLREEMGFQGVLISDWGAIAELILHGVATDKEEAAKLSLEAGVDIDMMSMIYSNALQKLLEEEKISEAMIDECVLRILELKNKLGLFENPYKDADEEEEQRLLLCEEHRNVAREMAEKSFVLLKNEEEMLPLSNKGKTIAFIGPYVETKRIYGCWSIFAKEEETVSLREALEGGEYANRFVFEQGCELLESGEKIPEFGSGHAEGKLSKEEELALLIRAIKAASEADYVVVAIGEHPSQSGEAASRANITLPLHQLNLLKEIYAVNQNIVVVLFNGRPLDLREVCQYAKAVLEVWMPGTEGGTAIANVLFGKANPSGKLAMSFPYSVGQVPVYYNGFSTGRPCMEGCQERFFSRYLDIPNEPLFPFGFGLSYTTFTYSDVILDRDRMSQDEIIHASVTVKNTGAYEGEEVVQLYLQDVKGSVVRPVRELKGFEKIRLLPGESRTVSFSIAKDMLRYYQRDMSYDAEPGLFYVYIGGDSTAQNRAEFYYV